MWLSLFVSAAQAASWTPELSEALVVVRSLHPDLVATAASEMPRRDRAGQLRFGAVALAEPEAAPVLLDRLLRGDENPEVRVALAQILARPGHDAWHHVEMSVLATDADPRVRAALVHGLRHVDAEAAEAGLTAALSDADPTVRAEAVRVIGARADGGRWAASIEIALADAEAQVVAAAIRAAGWLRLVQVSGTLRDRLSHDDGAVRYEAIKAMRRLGALLPADLASLKADPDPRVARLARQLQ